MRWKLGQGRRPGRGNAAPRFLLPEERCRPIVRYNGRTAVSRTDGDIIMPGNDNAPGGHPAVPIRFFTEEELDALEQVDPDRAYRIARAQAMAERSRARTGAPALTDAPPDAVKVREAVEDVRQILMRDGGDIELVNIQGSTVQVRMKGACAGCPNSVLDLKNVVEKVVLAVPGVARVENTF